MNFDYRTAKESDFECCIEIRGKTRDNPVPRHILESMGVTSDIWTPKIRNGDYIGMVGKTKGNVVGFCFGDATTGEVLVLSVLPEYEGRGVGRKLLSDVMQKLYSFGHFSLHLYASSSPSIRAYGFYRYLGWAATGEFDDNNDELLKHTKTLVYN